MALTIVKSKSGIPCLWESGGGFSNTGHVNMICDSKGLPKRAIYIRRRGELACGSHALIPIAKGDVVIDTNHHRKDFDIQIFKITSNVFVKDNEKLIEAELIHEFDHGEWNSEPPEFLANAIEAAKQKATDYHCRVPYYVIDPEIK